MFCEAWVSFAWSISVDSFWSFAIVAASGVAPALRLPAASAIFEK